MGSCSSQVQQGNLEWPGRDTEESCTLSFPPQPSLEVRKTQFHEGSRLFIRAHGCIGLCCGCQPSPPGPRGFQGKLQIALLPSQDGLLAFGAEHESPKGTKRWIRDDYNLALHLSNPQPVIDTQNSQDKLSRQSGPANEQELTGLVLDFWISLAKCWPKLTMIPKKAFGSFGNLLPRRSEQLRCRLGHIGI